MIRVFNECDSNGGGNDIAALTSRIIGKLAFIFLRQFPKNRFDLVFELVQNCVHIAHLLWIHHAKYLLEALFITTESTLL